jgi:hypothetical protein
MSGKLAGVARISVNGMLLESMPGAEIDLGGKEREQKVGRKVYGYMEKAIAATMTCTIVWKNGTPIEDIRNITEGLIVFEADIGVTYQIANAVLLKPPKFNDENGEWDLEFGGDTAEPQ